MLSSKSLHITKLRILCSTTSSLRKFCYLLNDSQGNGKNTNAGEQKKKIAVAISGGVDSAVTALMLKKQGYDIIGVHMQNWEKSGDETLDKQGESIGCSEVDRKDAETVCRKLDIPFHFVSFAKEYWVDVWETTVKEFATGWLTPNPDILCNRYIKANILPKYVKENFGIETIATGHYARIEQWSSETGTKYKLLKGIDKDKDQSYFLSYLNQNQLSRMKFPLGEFTKKQIKTIAAAEGFDFLSTKKESMGVCFVGKRKSGFSSFLSQFIPPKPGNLIYQNVAIGTHEGLHSFTIGQKANISGCHAKLYCIGKNVARNEIILGEKQCIAHPKTAYITDINWIAGSAPPGIFEGKITVQARIRHLSECYPVEIQVESTASGFNDLEAIANLLHLREQSVVQVSFNDSLDSPLAAGQYTVFYDNDECLGGGKIFHLY